MWVSCSDKRQQTPLHVLAGNSHKLWSESRADSGGVDVFRLEEAAIAAWLVENGCPINAQDADGNTALHCLFVDCSASLCQIGGVPLLLCLLERGADMCGLRNCDGCAALDLLLRAQPVEKQQEESLTFHDVVKPRLERASMVAAAVMANTKPASYKLKGYSYLSLYFTKQVIPNALANRYESESV